MPSAIEDYALLSDTESAALVARDGSIDWLAFPRFDSGACFAALLGTEEHGRWRLAPADPVTRVERRYRPGTLVLDTTFHTASGSVCLTDCMPIRSEMGNLVRRLTCTAGKVRIAMHLTVRFDYGSIVPWVRRVDGKMLIVAGPDALALSSSVPVHGQDFSTVADFTLARGESADFELTRYPSHLPEPNFCQVSAAIEATERLWTEWSQAADAASAGKYADAVRDSLVVLKGLTYAPTGGIVAAATTSLPEAIGGPRNWDYRYCWLRDATFSLLALMTAGYQDEATAWRDWLLRAVAGRPEQAQIMYGAAGEHRLTEIELDWLPGYRDSRPVRVGNDAHRQFQLDVYGEVLDALHHHRDQGGDDPQRGWPLETKLVKVVEDCWTQPDDGLWEVRGGRQHFTHSKVMAWVALDRAIRSAESHDLRAPLSRWKGVRDEIRRDVLAKGVNSDGVFTQAYGSTALDASLLMIPLVGFLPADDVRVQATVAAIQRDLTENGFVYRYRPDDTNDGLAGDEGAFLMCTFWLADVLGLSGRRAEAARLFERLLDLRNDVGLLSEQYDPTAKRFLGNIPQAFSHVASINTATAISSHRWARAKQ